LYRNFSQPAKTGTLTTGRAEVTGIAALEGSETTFLSTLASVEAHSERRIADALRREAARRGLALTKCMM